MESDLEFARRCASGDRQAWDEFLIRYSRLIYTYIFSSARSAGIVLSAQEKDDTFQELILSLLNDNFRKLKTFRGLNGCSLASWLRQVTVNFTLNRSARKAAVSLDQPYAGELSFKDSIPDTGKHVAEAFHEREKIIRLTECIELLETGDKYFLELNLHLGLSLEEIKDHLKITRGAADMRKARIVDRLRECFKGKGLIIDG
jgi:RNA polymerase sigma factor (sigma-70 family)